MSTFKNKYKGTILLREDNTNCVTEENFNDYNRSKPGVVMILNLKIIL